MCTPCRPTVDRQRFDIMYESAFEILQNKRQAQVFAAWALYLLVGYEQAAAAPATPRRWSGSPDSCSLALDSDGFASVPDGD